MSDKGQLKIKKNLKKTQSLTHYSIIALIRGSHGLSAKDEVKQAAVIYFLKAMTKQGFTFISDYLVSPS